MGRHVRSFRLWLTLVGATLAAGVLVPYGVLSGGPPSLDVFVFWCVFGAVVIALIVAGFARWRV